MTEFKVYSIFFRIFKYSQFTNIRCIFEFLNFQNFREYKKNTEILNSDVFHESFKFFKSFDFKKL